MREIQALQRELAARGLLHSGAMLKRVLAACTSALEAQATTAIAEYEWAATHALVVTQSWTESLVSEACQSFQALQTASLTHLAKASGIAGRPELAAHLESELSISLESCKQRVALALRSKFAERKRGLVRGLPSLIPRLVARFFSGGST